MKKHKHAIKNLRQSLADLTEHKRHVKAQIQALKFDAGGQRRPETGPERDSLWHEYVWTTRPQARAIHIALGMLKGTPYASIESKHADDNGPPLYGVLKAIHVAIGDDEELKAEWTLDRLQKLVAAKPAAKEAA